jgi:hypothetical protein
VRGVGGDGGDGQLHGRGSKTELTKTEYGNTRKKVKKGIDILSGSVVYMI